MYVIIGDSVFVDPNLLFISGKSLFFIHLTCDLAYCRVAIFINSVASATSLDVTCVDVDSASVVLTSDSNSRYPT
jgi:hypothetical protein